MISSITWWYKKLRAREVNFWINNPIECQNRTLQYLLCNGEQTLIGKKYGFAKIKNYNDFKKSVPISNYDDTLPYIEQMMNGAKDILTQGTTNWFAKSSGTSNQVSKFIPLPKTNLNINHYNSSRDMISAYCFNYPDTKLFSGKCLIIGGSHKIHSHNGSSRYGDLSSVLLEKSPWLGRLFRTPKLSIAIMEDWEKKLETIAKQSISENITSFAGVPTWNLILFKMILEMTGKKYLKEVWPNLELYMHGGVSFEPYKSQFDELIGVDIGAFRYKEIYNASEGFLACSLLSDSNELCLMLNHGVFFEFMEVQEYYGNKEKVLALAEVEREKNYAVIISSNNGLWRYVLGDTVTFTSLYPFCIKITGRLQHFINVFGEEVIVSNTDNAIKKACGQHRCSISEYTVAPVFFSNKQKPCHEWLIEFEEPPKNYDKFTQDLDNALQNLNSDYQAKRTKDIALQNLKLRVAKKGLFKQWLISKNKLGGQHKIPRLSNTRDLMEDMLSINI